MAVFLPSNVPATSVAALFGLLRLLLHALQRLRQVALDILQLRHLLRHALCRHSEADHLAELRLEIRQLCHPQCPFRRHSPRASRAASIRGSPRSRISFCVSSIEYGTRWKRSKHPLEIEQQPGRSGIAVARLADGAGIEQPAPVELQVGPAGSKTAGDAAVRGGDGERDMAVSDENDRRCREVEGRLRRLLGQDVLPDGIARARVEEVDAVGCAGGLKALQKRARALRELPCRPDCRRRRLVVEVADADLAERDEVVVADEADVAPLPHDVAALVRQRPVADDVAEAPDRVHALRVDLLQDRLERVEVSVNV